MTYQNDDPEKYLNGPLPGYLKSVGIEIETEILGKGGFSVAFAGRFAGEPCAIKVSKFALTENEATTREYERGSRIWPLTRKHAFINTLLWHGKAPVESNGDEHLCTVWERAETSLDKYEPSSLVQIHSFLRNISSALRFLHARNVVHRDIKPANLLVVKTFNGRLEAQLADLGMARFNTADSRKTFCGTPLYSHPSQIAEAQVSPICDVFSLVWVYLDLVARCERKGLVRSEETMRDHRKAKEFIWALPIPDSVKEICEQVVVLDGRERTVPLTILVDEIGKHLVSETIEGDDERGGHESATILDSETLSSKGLVPDVVLHLAAIAVGTEPHKLPWILKQNVNIVGAFRAKELAHELILAERTLSDAASSIEKAIRTYEPTDSDSVLKKPIAK